MANSFIVYPVQFFIIAKNANKRLSIENFNFYILFKYWREMAATLQTVGFSDKKIHKC